jgi:methylglyoxal synthase
MEKTKRIALAAHDRRKKKLSGWVESHFNLTQVGYLISVSNISTVALDLFSV